MKWQKWDEWKIPDDETPFLVWGPGVGMLVAHFDGEQLTTHWDGSDLENYEITHFMEIKEPDE